MRGLVRTADNPLPVASTFAVGGPGARPSDAQVVADTIREETGG